MKTVALVIALTITSCSHSQNLSPTRKVSSSTVTSVRDPRLSIKLPDQVQYLGSDRWVLYDVADCEIHVFVEADESKRVQRLYWIQLDGYIPERSELTYKYSDKLTTIGGADFFTKARFGRSDELPKTGSDLEHVRRLIEGKGYTLPDEMMNVRFVHLPDDSRRKELMIIYSEDLAPTRATVAQLIPDGLEGGRWTEISKELINRAKERILIGR